jgi:RimJ/RimL family protein N-acetyltransferase
LQTPRFVLRELTRADARPLFPAFSDPDVMRWWSRGPFASEAELEDWLVPETGWEQGRSWAIADNASSLAFGRMVAIDRGDGVSEIGYLLVPTRQRQGIAREALGALITHLIFSEKRRRIFADVDPDNVASIRLLERLGFTLEGRLRQHCTTHLGRRDSLIWGLLDEEWTAKPQG